MAEKWDLICQNASIMLMTSSKQGKRPFFKSNAFIQRQHEWLKDEEAVAISK